MTLMIRCGQCHYRHASVQQVRDCYTYARQRAANVHNVRTQVAPSPRPNQWSFKAPEQMVRGIQTGRYAVTPDSNTAYTFVRVLRPTKGKRRGCTVIDTQHGDEFKMGLIFYPNGTFWVSNKTDRLDQALILIAVDPVTGARNYGRELGRCSRCGKQLTDERSRWYGIGPECEKYWADLIAEVDEEQGGPHFLGRVWIEVR